MAALGHWCGDQKLGSGCCNKLYLLQAAEMGGRGAERVHGG